jgi:hypothetical protein
MSVLTDVRSWIGFLMDHVWVLGLTMGVVITGWLLGFLGSASFGRRGRLYGAMVAGMIVNIVAKLEGLSYTTAAALMAIITALTFLLGFVSNAWVFKLFVRGQAEG